MFLLKNRRLQYVYSFCVYLTLDSAKHLSPLGLSPGRRFFRWIYIAVLKTVRSYRSKQYLIQQLIFDKRLSCCHYGPFKEKICQVFQCVLSWKRENTESSLSYKMLLWNLASWRNIKIKTPKTSCSSCENAVRPRNAPVCLESLVYRRPKV